MSDRPVISSENLPTVAAVAVILGLLSIAYGIYLHRQILIVAVGSGALDVRAAKSDDRRDKEIADLKARLGVLEQQAANTTAAAAAPTAGAGEAAAPVQ